MNFTPLNWPRLITRYIWDNLLSFFLGLITVEIFILIIILLMAKYL